VDDNWYEGERNAMIGIFPVTYVEMIPNESVGSSMNRSKTTTTSTVSSSTLQRESAEGKGKAKYNFQAQTPMELSLIKGNYKITNELTNSYKYFHYFVLHR
jgi:sorbin and SH3 domain-containing protein 1